MAALFVEHICSYIFDIIRGIDIEANGKPDQRGVYRAILEQNLQTIEIFIDSLLLGYTLNAMKNMSHA